MKTLYYLLLILLVGLQTSCVKVDDASIVPESLPLSLKTLDKSRGSFVERQDVVVIYDSTKGYDQIFNVEVRRRATKNIEKYILFTSEGRLGVMTNQITFYTGDFSTLEDVYLIPYLYDVNNNNVKDYLFFLWYKDSLTISAFDHSLERADQWQTLKKFSRENFHYLRLLSIWRNPANNNSYLILRKSNRLKTKYIKVDTLIAFNLDRQKIEMKFPVGPCYWHTNSVFQDGKYFALKSEKVSNNLRFQNMDDRNCYISIYNTSDRKANGMLLHPTDSAVYCCFRIHGGDEVFYSQTKYDTRNELHQYLYRKNLNTLETIELGEFPLYYTLAEIFDNDSHPEFLFHDRDNDKLLVADSNLSVIRQADIPIKLSFMSWSNYLCLDVTTMNPRVFGERKLDINNDGCKEFFGTSLSNQIILFDGKTLEPLLTTEKYPSLMAYCFVRDTGKIINVLISDGKTVETFKIIRTPFLSKVLVYYKELFFISIFIILPILFIQLRRLHNQKEKIRIEKKQKGQLKIALAKAHTIKTLVAIIKINFTTLKNKCLDNQRSEIIQESKNRIDEQLKIIIDELNMISYLGDEKINTKYEKFDLHEYTTDWINNNKHRFEQYKLLIENHIPTNIPKVNLNEDHFNYLLIVACDNSNQAMKEGQKEKKVIIRTEEKQDELYFIIEDNGIGMPEQILAKVRQNISYSSKENGSGLGIQLINQVCIEHNAELVINSSENHGTSLSIIFKL